MDFSLIAQNNAFWAGVVIGLLLITLFCASVPIAVGAAKGQPVLGVVGGIISGVLAFLFGIYGGVPSMLLFVVIILVVGANQPQRYGRHRRRPRRDDYDDYDDDDDDDDRPRRRRKSQDW